MKETKWGVKSFVPVVLRGGEKRLFILIIILIVLAFGVCGVVAVAAQVQYKFCGTILKLDSHFWGIGGAGIIWEDKETERDIEYST